MFLERHFAADSFIHSRCIIVDAEAIETKNLKTGKNEAKVRKL